MKLEIDDDFTDDITRANLGTKLCQYFKHDKRMVLAGMKTM